MGSPHYHPCDLDCPNGLTAGALGISVAEVFKRLRDNFGALTGTEIYRPHIGDRYLVHRRSHVEQWLDEQEELINKGDAS